MLRFQSLAFLSLLLSVSQLPATTFAEESSFYRFDFTKWEWEILPTNGAPPVPDEGFDLFVAAPVNREMVLWGTGVSNGTRTNLSAKFDPQTGQWQKLPPAPLPNVTKASAAVVHNKNILVLEPSADGVSGGTFARIPLDGTPAAATKGKDVPDFTTALPAVVGDKWLVWGNHARRNPGASQLSSFDLASSSWKSLTPPLTPLPQFVNVFSTLGADLLAFGTRSEFGCLPSGAIYSVKEGTWTPVAGGGAPQNCDRALVRLAHENKLIVWGGTAAIAPDSKSPPQWLKGGGVYNTATRGWEAIPEEGAPLITENENILAGYHSAWYGNSLWLLRFQEPEQGSFNCPGYRYDSNAKLWSTVVVKGDRSTLAKYQQANYEGLAFSVDALKSSDSEEHLAIVTKGLEIVSCGKLPPRPQDSARYSAVSWLPPYLYSFEIGAAR